MTDDIANVERSEEYLGLLKELKESFTTPIDIALKIRKQGKKDGLSNDIIREDIEIALEGTPSSSNVSHFLDVLDKTSEIASDMNKAK